MSETENNSDGQSREDLVDMLRLCLIPGVGPRIRQLLLERFGSPRAVFDARRNELRAVKVKGVGSKLIDKIVAAEKEIDAEAEIALCQQHGIQILICPGEEDAESDYPRMLREIHDPPGVLFMRGESKTDDGLAIGIVGTRHATQYGRRQAERLAGSLARAGLTVVSGLARGIDGVAHRGALDAGGRTIAVLASGVLNIYPPEHKELAEAVVAGGALLSEAPPRAEPLAGAFPQRNRLISGMSLGVLVVEAPERSGALITARHAMEQGREVFAVPGQIDCRAARGCHRLIRDGAKLVESADDILEELGPLVEATPREDGQVVHHPAELQLNELEQKVLAEIGTEATSIDEIVAKSELPVQRVLSTISVLEMRHLIRRLSGTTVVRK